MNNKQVALLCACILCAGAWPGGGWSEFLTIAKQLHGFLQQLGFGQATKNPTTEKETEHAND